MTQRPEPYERYVDDAVYDLVEQHEQDARERGVSPAALAFAWVLERCDGAVCGPGTAAQLDPVVEAMELVAT